MPFAHVRKRPMALLSNDLIPMKKLQVGRDAAEPPGARPGPMPKFAAGAG